MTSTERDRELAEEALGPGVVVPKNARAEHPHAERNAGDRRACGASDPRPAVETAEAATTRTQSAARLSLEVSPGASLLKRFEDVAAGA